MLAQLKDDRDPELHQNLLTRLETLQNTASQDREQNVDPQAWLPTFREMSQRLQVSRNDSDDTLSEQLAAVTTEMQRLDEGLATLRTADDFASELSEDKGVGMGEGAVSEDEEALAAAMETMMVETKTVRVETVLDNIPANDDSGDRDSC